jgi:hypothetical protein
MNKSLHNRAGGAQHVRGCHPSADGWLLPKDAKLQNKKAVKKRKNAKHHERAADLTKAHHCSIDPDSAITIMKLMLEYQRTCRD